MFFPERLYEKKKKKNVYMISILYKKNKIIVAWLFVINKVAQLTNFTFIIRAFLA